MRSALEMNKYNTVQYTLLQYSVMLSNGWTLSIGNGQTPLDF